MSLSTSYTDFVQKFNPRDESHVIWLKAMGTAMGTATSGGRVNLDTIVNANPLGCKMTNMLDMAEMHFGISMKYANAVLNCDAFVPKKE